jgi:hypothetical protein
MLDTNHMNGDERKGWDARLREEEARAFAWANAPSRPRLTLRPSTVTEDPRVTTWQRVARFFRR